MKRQGIFFNCTTIALALVLFSGLLFSDYIEPTFDKIPFNPDRLTLSAEEKTAIADDLANAARSLQDSDPKVDFLRGKILAVALRLTPQGKLPVVTNAMLKTGKTPKAAEGYTLKAAGDRILKAALKISAPKDGKEAPRPDIVCAVHLLNLLASIDPDNEDLIFQIENEKAKQKTPVSWATIIQEAKAKPEKKVAAKPTTDEKEEQSQVKVNGLVVVGGDLGGKVSEIMAVGNFAPNEDHPITTRITNGGEIANDMKISLDEATRLIRLRHPEAKGVTIAISFDDKYSAKGGGSAGTAFSIALVALIKHFEIDPTFAVTGDITVDGKVRKIGGVPHKLKGAVLDRMSLIAIPKLNEDDWMDYVALTSSDDLLKAQIFSIETVDQALDLAPLKRKPEIQKTLDDVRALLASINADPGVLRKSETLVLLKSINQAMPSHLTVKYLIDKSQGKISNKLSRAYCISEIVAILDPLWVIAYSPSDSSLGYRFSEEYFTAAKNKFENLKSKIPSDTETFFYDLFNFLEAVERYQNAYKSVPNLRSFSGQEEIYTRDPSRRDHAQELQKLLKSIQEGFVKFHYDQEFIDKMIR